MAPIKKSKSDLRVFISHSSKDVDLIRELVVLLEKALTLRSNEIRCTSLDGYRLPGGADVESQLRSEVKSASVLVGLLTPASLASHYVLFELGARWGAGLPLIPLVAASDDRSRLHGPITALNILDLSNASQTHQLLQELATQLGVALDSAASYNAQLDRLLAAIRSQARASGTHASDLVTSIGGYSVHASGIVTDQRTGLDWYVGPDVNTDWPTAVKWTSELAVGGGGWRMPSSSELQTLFDKTYTAGIGYYKNGKHWPAHMHPVFQAIGGGSWVWSAESENKASASAFNFNQGRPEAQPRSNTNYSIRAFAVRVE